MKEQEASETRTSNEKNENLLKLINEIAATIILLLSAICVIVAIVIFACGSKRNIVQHEYTYTIKVDSVSHVTPGTQVQIDSIISSIKQHENTIKDRYDYVLEQRETSQDYITVGGIFVTVILSIFGFFGYKSFKSIEEDAKQSAKKIAEDKTEEIANDKATSVSQKMNQKLENELRRDQAETLKEYKDKYIPDIVNKVVQQKFGSEVGDKMEKINGALEKISELEQYIADFKKARDEDYNQVKETDSEESSSIQVTPGLQPDDLNELAKEQEETNQDK